jgi:hypothetical protein
VNILAYCQSPDGSVSAVKGAVLPSTLNSQTPAYLIIRLLFSSLPYCYREKL